MAILTLQNDINVYDIPCGFIVLSLQCFLQCSNCPYLKSSNLVNSDAFVVSHITNMDYLPLSVNVNKKDGMQEMNLKITT